ncbi:hypothetical protein HN789_07215 [archaeon]|jgi:hypothetical protein|nr:hypothetical protein [archaeon]MBT4021771.1 hypothetical protein [archaeon]MBT4271814.1 hypothetical protein [archaeon]MBT4460491.1 hypothetical protein [archaeon]MBT4858511.1 hypothetical protein [archaeon]
MRLGSIIEEHEIQGPGLTTLIKPVLDPTLDEFPSDIGFDKYNVPAIAIGDNWVEAFIIDNTQLGGGKRTLTSVSTRYYDSSEDIRKVVDSTCQDFLIAGYGSQMDGKSVFLFPWSSAAEDRLSTYARVSRQQELPYFGQMKILSQNRPVFVFPNQNPYQVEELEEPITFSFRDTLKLIMPWGEKFSDDLLRSDGVTKLGLEYSIGKKKSFSVMPNVFGQTDFYGIPENVLNLTWTVYGMQKNEEKPIALHSEEISRHDFPNSRMPKGGLLKHAITRAREVSEQYVLPVQTYHSKG